MSLKALSVSSLLVAGLALGSIGSANRRLVSVDLDIELKPGRVSEATASALASGYGRIVRMTPNGVVLRLDSPVGLEGKIKKLKKRKSVAKVESMMPHLPGEGLLNRPFSELTRGVDEYREAYIEWANYTHTALKVDAATGRIKVQGTGYLQSYLQWKHDRSYPNDSIDITGYSDIALRRTFASQLQEKAQGSTVREASLTAQSLGSRGAAGKSGPQEDISGRWEFMGPKDLRAPYTIYFGLSPINGRANALAFDPVDANTFYTCGSMGGVWKTTDGGVNWSTTTDAWPLLGVSSLAVHPTNGNIILAGTGDFYGSDVAGIGVMRSTDAGQTWTRTGLNMGSSMVPGLVFYPENPNIVFAVAGRAGGSTRGVYRSADAGQNWTEVVTTDTDWSYVDVGALRTNGTRTIWAVAGGSSAIRTSVDQGVTWTTITPPVTGSVNPLHIAASKINPDTAYLLSTSNNKIYKTTNAGASWTDISAGFQNGSNNYNWSQGWYDYYIKTSTVNGQDMIYVGLIDVVLSVNGGTTWRNIGGSNYTAAYSNTAVVHQDNHNCAVDPNNPNRALIATDGGVFLFTYNPTADTYTWSRLNKALGITQFYTLAVHPTNPDYVMGGTQDNSTPHSFTNLAQWQNPGAGDGAGCGINWNNPNIQYNSSQYHGLTRTTNAWSSSSSFAPNFGSDSVPFIGELWLDPNDPTNVYANTNYLWRYKEGTGTWTPRLGGVALSTSGQIRAVGIAPGNSNIIYTGASDGDLYMSRDFGATWKRLDNLIGFTNRSILDISVSPSNPDDILVAVGGSGDHLYRITNTNAATPTLVSVNGGAGVALPNVAASSIARDPWQPESRWYIGTDVGVFTTANSGASYTDITQPLGLPNVQVNELKVNATTRYLTAATFGRGIWRMKLIPAQIQSVVATPGTVMSGDGGMLTVTIDRIAPTGGVTVPLVPSSTDLQTAPTVFIPAGSSSVQVPFTTSEVANTQNVTVTAELGGVATAMVTLQSTVNFAATKFAHFNTINVTGSFAEILNSDDVRMSWQVDRLDRLASKVDFALVIEGLVPSKLRVEIEASSSVSNIQYTLYVVKGNTSDMDVVASGQLTQSDQTIRADIVNPATYLGQDGEFEFLLVTNSATPMQFTTFVDRVRVRALP